MDKNFTFLCVKVSAAEGLDAVSSGGMLPPMHLSFESTQPYYPLKFSSRQGVFDVNLHVLTRDKFDYKKSSDTLTRLNWGSQHYNRNVKLKEKDMPKSLKKAFAESAWKGDIKTWRYNNLRCYQVNKGDSISTWNSDITFVAN